MFLSTLFFLLALLLANHLVVSEQVHNSSQLEDALCRNRSGKSLVIELTELSYDIINCKVVFKNVIVNIIGNEATSSINCINSSQVNFVFENSTVVLRKLKFIGCGGLVPLSRYINSQNAFLKFSNELQNMTLFFVHSSLHANNVTIKSYNGYAMIGINMWKSNLTKLNVSLGGNHYGASGIVIQYNDDIEKYGPKINNKNMYTLIFWNSTFSYNFNTKGYNSSIHYCFYKRYLYSNDKTQEVFPAAGLTILYTQTKYRAQVSIVKNSTFLRNTGLHAGALMIVHYIPHGFQPAVLNSATIIERTRFERNSNSALCSGAAIAFYWIVFSKHTKSHSPLKPLLINNSIFVNQEPIIEDDHIQENSFASGNMYIGILPNQGSDIIIIISNSNFHDNAADKSNALNGACLTAESYDLVKSNKDITIVLESISADKNYQNSFKQIHDHSSTGIFSFFNLPRVEICGASNFQNNNGSVIYSGNSHIYLSDNITFLNNSAVFGPAIRMEGNSQLHFSSGLQALFQNNIAEKLGGALCLQKDSTPFDDNLCVMNISSSDNGKDIQFVNNQAVDGGNSIYAYPLYSCYNKYINGDYIDNTSYYKDQMFFINTARYSNSLLDISSKPSNLSHNLKKQPTHIHPGTTFEMEFGALFHQKFVWANLDITTEALKCKLKKNKPNDCHMNTLKGMVKLPKNVQWYTLKEGYNYTAINITILVNHVFSGDFDVTLGFSIYNGEFTDITSVTVYACPLGFQLKEATGKCDCSESLHQIMPHYDIQCDINQLKIKRPDWNIPWIGEYDPTGNNSYTTGVSKTCPVEYCTVNKRYKFFKISDDKQVILFNPENSTDYQSLCQFNRTGVLCSQCPDGTSVVLGSPECKHCPVGYTVLTVFIFLLAGPLLIFSLYALQLTLTTGTLNGIIFYAQAANAGLVDMLDIHLAGHSSSAVWVIGRICITILSFLNLNLGGFSLCFLGNLSELSKAGLSLLFPIYLLTIVVVLIFLSRFSQKLSNYISHSSIQVLVTVVHLSFSNLLGRTIKVFSPAVIYYDNGTERGNFQVQVWYYDGAVTYSESRHLALMIITLIVGIMFVLPYIVILICARPLRRSPLSSKYLRPFIEAIHAPYKEGKEYWFVGRLIALMIIYVLYMYYITVSITKIYVSVTPIISSMLFLQAYLKPFKKKLVNILDCWIMFLLLIVGIMSWYFLEENNYLGSNIICEISVFLFLITFVVVLFYHIAWVTGLIDYAQYLVRGFQRRRDERRKSHFSIVNGGTDVERNGLSARNTDMFYGSTSYRESLLSSVTSDV